MLAIVFACDHFEAYIYDREQVNIETDHQPLVSIITKPLNKAPDRLQRMLLRLQKYSLRLKYKKGPEMYLADTLSRAYLPEVNVCESIQKLEEVDHTSTLAIPADRIERLKQASSEDPVLDVLRLTVLKGWPETKSEVPESIHAYYDIRDELTVQDSLIFKGQRLVIPVALRKEMIELVHTTHIGVEGCLRRARETMYWPRMSTELKEYISKCDVCASHRVMQGKEPLQQHRFAARPWSKVGADLCELKGRTLLVVSDYFSNYVEVENVSKPNTNGVTKPLKAMFARWGVPEELVSDNGPQFSSTEFAEFSRKWGFEHTTSSPHYPQSNGKAENAVKTVKRLFTKAREAGQSEFQALLDWRNTPTEGIGTSPAQRFLGRRCKTLLPTTRALLQPQYSTEKDTQAINQQKKRQELYYNRQTKSLTPLTSGDTVRLRLPGEKTWSAGVCTGLVGPRSYKVQVGGHEYRRNRRQVIQTEEPREIELPEAIVQEEQPSSEQGPAPNDTTRNVSPQLETNIPKPVRRSGRNRKSPDWFMNYVPA